MEKNQKDQGTQQQSGKQNQRDNQDQHGVISVVQSPDEDNNKSGNQNHSDTENKSKNQKQHGVISIVQSPDEENNKKEPMPKSPTMDKHKQHGSQHGNMEHKGMNKANTQAKFANVDESEEDMIDDMEEGNLYQDGTSQNIEEETMIEKIRKEGI